MALNPTGAPFIPVPPPWLANDDELAAEVRGRVALAILDAGGAAPLCDTLALAAKILAHPSSSNRRRPRGRRLRAGVSEADGLRLVILGVHLALMVIFHALRAGREEPAISREGVDPVARTVLDAGGHVAAAQLLAAARTDNVPPSIRDQLDNLCQEFGAAVLRLLSLRPQARAAVMEANAAVERQRAAAT